MEDFRPILKCAVNLRAYLVVRLSFSQTYKAAIQNNGGVNFVYTFLKIDVNAYIDVYK